MRQEVDDLSSFKTCIQFMWLYNHWHTFTCVLIFLKKDNLETPVLDDPQLTCLKCDQPSSHALVLWHWNCLMCHPLLDSYFNALFPFLKHPILVIHMIQTYVNEYLNQASHSFIWLLMLVIYSLYLCKCLIFNSSLVKLR